MSNLFDLEYEEDYSIGHDEDADLDLLLTECRKYKEKIDEEKVIKAFRLCCDAHREQRRASELAYYTHPLKVSLIMMEEFGIRTTEMVIVCLLHDTIEDTKNYPPDRIVTKEKIAELFDEEIAEMVEALTKIKHSATSASLNKAMTYRKLFLALVKDVRVIIIKLADRLHNMRTLHYLRKSKQEEIGDETINFYAPIAHRLGLKKVKGELEDLSLFFTQPDQYDNITKALKKKNEEFREYIRVFIAHIQQSLAEHHVKHIITIEHKAKYEVYQMINEGTNVEAIDNFYSLVIILDSNDKFECYKVHGILVNAFNPVDSLVDHVAQPRINWFQSLNTILLGPDGKLVEVIIRTQEMEDLADGGISVFFSLNQINYRGLNISEDDLELWGNWMESVILEENKDAMKIIWDSIKNNIFDTEVIVFNQDSVKYDLPKGATPVDLAFRVSKETGLHCISAKVNGQIKNLNYELKNGDRVMIITSPNAKPSIEWKNFVVSFRATIFLYNYFLEHPEEIPQRKLLTENSEVKLVIKGDDRPGTLKAITSAIGETNIKRINLDSTEDYFEGAIILIVKDESHYNSLFTNLLSVKGIRSIERIEDENY